MKLSEKITLLRKQKGFSQEDLANMLDVSRQAVYKWENDASMPDIDKIKKMASLFDISFDRLLNDQIDITQQNTANSNIVNTAKVYRDVFNSGFKLNYNQPDIDHGYTENRNKKLKNSNEIYEHKTSQMKEFLEAMGIENYILFQSDLCGCFFQNENDFTFGFYYDGNIQFLCPYENFISVHLNNSGNKMDYGRQTVFGVGLGAGGINSIGVGSIPQLKFSKPSNYTLTISYFDKNGKVNEFKLDVNCNRRYTIYQMKKIDEIDLFNEIQSDFANKQLNNIVAKLETCHALAEKIFNKEIDVKNINIEEIKKTYNKRYEKENEFKTELEQEVLVDNIRRKKNMWIVLGVLAGIFIFVLIVNTISHIVEKTQMEALDKSKAAIVVELIDQIGEVTLEDKDLLFSIEDNYNDLTSAQKSYVTNYSIYTEAKSQYNILYKNYMEEYTKDDPTRNITLEDLNGTWECDKYKITIGDFANGKSVWYRTYNKQTQSYGIGGGVASNLPSSSIGEYDCLTQTMSARLYEWGKGIFSKYHDITLTKSIDGELTMHLMGYTFIKN